jgi:hypothetical protein
LTGGSVGHHTFGLSLDNIQLSFISIARRVIANVITTTIAADGNTLGKYSQDLPEIT